MPDVSPRLKGTPTATGARPWRCKYETPECSEESPCPNCRGAANRRNGLKRQRQGRKPLERIAGPAAGFATKLTNEESWRFGIRFESKAGKQVGPIATRFLAAEKQSHQAKAIGSSKPFAMLAMPDEWGSDGIFLCRISELARIVEGFVNA